MTGELPWLEAPWRRAGEALAAGRLPQGLLVVGRRGLGRHRLALAIAAAALCEQPGDDGRACGRCPACRQVAAETHPDLVHVRVREDKTAILVEQVRELSRALSLSSGSHGRRCAIVHQAERMNKAAANALLKTLEEPGSGVSIILVADRVAAVPVTIASRCLQLPVLPPPREEALEWLNRQERRADWPLLLALSAEAPLGAMDLAETWPGDPGRDIRGVCSAAAGRSDPLAVAAALKGLPIVVLAQLMAWLARSTMRLCYDPRYPAAVEGLGEIARGAEPRALFRLWHAARTLAVDPSAVNAELARERLVLLFMDAVHRKQTRRG